MIIKTVPTGEIQANCYIVMDEVTSEAVIIDPGADEEIIENLVENMKAKVKFILLTHGHFDHVGAVEYLADKFNAPFYINKKDEEYALKDNYVFTKLRKANGYLKEGDTFTIGNKEVKVIETPGHSKGGVSFLINDNLFTGDTLFMGSIGRTDFIGGDFEEIISSIKTKLLPLGDNIKVYPGHGPSSSISYEKMRNPYLR